MATDFGLTAVQMKNEEGGGSHSVAAMVDLSDSKSKSEVTSSDEQRMVRWRKRQETTTSSGLTAVQRRS
ncbi:hypothetical protein U1Q18_043507 [Sarracenia purpurea var. burkii]